MGVFYCIGFFVGKEGPMIHSGAIIGAGIPQFRSMLFRFIKLPYAFFRSDRYGVAMCRRMFMYSALFYLDYHC